MRALELGPRRIHFFVYAYAGFLAALQFLSSGFTMAPVKLFLKVLSWGTFLLAALVIDRLRAKATERRTARP